MTRIGRLVLELGHGAADPDTIQEAAAFAHLVGAELHALFVEDETLLHASALPFAREISPLSYQWRPLKADRLEAELKAASNHARQHLEAAAHAAGIRRSFEVRRGDPALHVSDICIASDIVVVSPPGRSGSLTAQGFVRLRDVACQSVASVLYLPPRAGRKQGPIVAVAVSAADASLDTARWIAAAAHEQVLVLAPAGSDLDGLPNVRILPGTAVQDLTAAMDDLRERLIVVTRVGAADDPGLALSAARGVPILVTEPV
jgi:hypothetical protein